MVNKSSAIRNAYAEYQQMIHYRKQVLAATISIHDIRPNRADEALGKVGVNHVRLKRQMQLEIEVKINDISNFKFKLYCRSNFDCPIFRYDAKGPDHRNAKNTLKEQRVPAPHFHIFDSDGTEIAYRTKAIETKPAAFTQIQSGLDHFCEVGNLRYNQQFPKVLLFPNLLALHGSKQDPLENVKF